MENKNTDTETWMDIMKQFKPDITDDEANHVLWEHTCFPFDSDMTRKQITEYFTNLKDTSNAEPTI